MYRPNRHLVMADETTPARFRPANQMRLVPASPANPQLASSMLPGMGGVQSGNGVSSLGLVSGAADRRLQHAISVARKNAALTQRSNQLASLEGMRPDRNQLAGLGTAGAGLDALQVSFSWAGDSIAATRQKIIDLYDLRPVKPWGHLQTYVTTAFGSDMQALQDALGAQPIVSIFDITPYMPMPAAPNLNAPVEPTWQHVQTLQRPGGSRWIITKMVTPAGTRVAVTLYRTEGGNDTQVVRSDNLATVQDGIEYIRSYEVKVGDLSDAGRPRRTVFWNSFLRGNAASGMQHPMNAATAAQIEANNGRAPVQFRRTAMTRDVAPVDGLGDLHKPSLILAAVLFAGVVYLAKHKPSY